MKINFTTPKLISSIQFLVEQKPTTAVLSDIFGIDIDGDGIQEAIFTGRQSQPATIPTWSNATVHIFKKNASDQWVDVTSLILPDNIIESTQPGVLAGDFNNDGRVDFFIPSDTDMNYLVPSYLFINMGGAFTKQAFDFQTWAHGAAVADVNKDGYLDIISTDYGPRTGIGFGGPNGFDYKSTDWRGPFGPSGIAAADFLGDGTVTIMTSDDSKVNGGAGLYRWSVDTEGELTLSLISKLPSPMFENTEKWGSYKFSSSHDVRIIPFDFSGDGLFDAIQISRPHLTNGQWPQYSEVQFLLNMGAGVFIDVTDSKLSGYDNTTNASYQPKFLDLNGDGRLDIFVSAADYTSHTSTAALLQQADGTFVEFGREAFSNLWKSALAALQSVKTEYVFTDWGQTMQVLTGADGQIDVLSSVSYMNDQGGMSNMVFSSKLSFTDMLADEVLQDTAGSDRFDGGTGLDKLIYSGTMSTFEIAKVDGAYQVRGKSNSDNTDTVINIERLEFSDTSLALDIAGHAGITAKLLGATFGKASIANKDLVGIGLHMLDGGMGYSDLMGAVINAVLGSSASNAAAVDLLYTNVVGVAPSVNDLAFFTDWLDKGIYTKASFGVLAADTELNMVNVGLVGLASTGLEYTPYVA